MKIRVRKTYMIIVGMVLLLNVVFPPPRMTPRRYDLEVGEVAPYDVIAPYDFDIPVSERELMDEKQEITKRIPPIYVLDATIPGLVTKQINSFRSLLDSLKSLNGMTIDSLVIKVQHQYAIDRAVILYLYKNNNLRILEQITKHMSELYVEGIVDHKLPEVRIITILSGEKEIIETVDRMYSVEEALATLNMNQSKVYQSLVQFFLRPNITFDREKTDARIEEVFANVPRTKGKVLKGELIVEKHKRLNEESLEIIKALENSYISVGSWEIVKTLLFRNVFFLALAFFFFAVGRMTRIEFYKGKNLVFIALLTAVYLIVGKIVMLVNAIYLLPIALFIYLFALYFNTQLALVLTIVFASLFGITTNSLSIFVYLAISGFVATFSVQSIDSRSSLYRPMLYVAAANIAAIVFAETYITKGALSFVQLGEGILNSIIGSFCFVLVLPIFERIFDFTTDLTLLEFGNLNLPLFKEMALEAPGTYHHSIVTGSLSEVGARAIGADPILARVGAYYHDIGKLKKPEYFIENQIGVKNPHDTLKPQMSALIIISHVKEGMEMARKMKLPRSLINMIEQHHGTTSIEVFYKKALKQSDGVQEDVFRYPGPKPKTKETAIVMLADSVEASARSEKNITVTKLQKIIKDTIDKKFNDGQLDECPLNRQDLEQIKTAFLSTLTGVFHPRVEYNEKETKNATIEEQ